MKTFFTIIAIVFVFASPFWYVYVIYRDLTHPNIWDKDWKHDPVIYLPLMVVVFPLGGLWWRWEYRKARRRDEKLRETFRLSIGNAYPAKSNEQ